MAPPLVHLLGAQAGAGAAVAAGIGAGGGAPAAPAGGGAAAGGPRAMRWNNNTSGFVLWRMTQLVSDDSRPDKVFKDKDVNHFAKALKEYSGEADSDTNAIMLEQEHYLGHCKDHPKDAEFLNCPIRFYIEMESIFGHTMANGRFALVSGEALGSNQAKSVAAKMPGFIEEALIVAYTYLLDNKAQGRGFVGMSDTQRDIWLKNYLAKNYYM
ncbi:unnamed protein product [Miscanthus lutarioriparius]|uniref:Uncharacterized protein n=1 Tax=Miscanthus lutarioriparius TaxID=422564 RepID=A0A811MVN5_9POAL|nr:unnamed protein product [Miscanthus lutarioriparius]